MRGFIHILILIQCVACNKFWTDELSTRFSESLSGKITLPSNIDLPGTNTFSFSIMGDPHVGSPFGHVLNQAVVHSKAGGDGFTIVTGDLTDRGKSSSFSEFKEIFAKNSMEYRAAIGNHDIYFGGWARFSTMIGPATYSFDVENTHFSVIDSANGVIGIKQLEWLDSDLKNSSQAIKIIVTHFSPYSGERQSVWRLSSLEESAILKNIAYENNVSIVVAAHMHGYLAKNLGNTLYLVSGGTNKILDPGGDRHYVRVSINGTDISVEKIEF